MLSRLLKEVGRGNRWCGGHRQTKERLTKLVPMSGWRRHRQAVQRGRERLGFRTRKLREKNYAYLVYGSSGERAFSFAFVRPAEWRRCSGRRSGERVRQAGCGGHNAGFTNSFCAARGSAAQAISGGRQIRRSYAAWQNCAPI